MAESMITDCQRVAEEIAYRFQGQNNYFRLSVEQGFQRTDDQTAIKVEDVIVHTKAYLNSTWADFSVDGLVDSLLRAHKIFPWQTTRDRFEETMETYLSNLRSCARHIKINPINLNILEAVSTLELIKVRVLSQYMVIAYTRSRKLIQTRRNGSN
jgi:hypothetical protein